VQLAGSLVCVIALIAGCSDTVSDTNRGDANRDTFAASVGGINGGNQDDRGVVGSDSLLTAGDGGTETDCDDGLDNDNDGFTDCDDTDCADDPACTPTEDNCDDGVDNDNDGFTDCDDTDCADDPACTPTEDNCDDGVDNDNDGFTDCDDFDCADDPACPSIEDDCEDGVDNDNDGFTDCDDFDCVRAPNCVPDLLLICPEPEVVECDGTSHVDDVDTWILSVVVESNCDNFTTDVDMEIEEDDCGLTSVRTVTWNVSNDCASESCSSTFTIENGEPPVIEGIEDATVDCDGAGNTEELDAWLASGNVIESCGEAVLTNDFESFDFECGVTGSVTVTWSATDECGQVGTATATFTILPADLMVNGADNLMLECDAGNADAIDAWLDTTTAENACAETSVENDFTELSDGCGQSGSAEVTWTATDECGQTTTHTATVTVEDTLAPSIMVPDDSTVECDGTDKGSELDAWLASAMANDQCGDATLTNDFTELTGGCGDTGSAEVTWTAEDECGQTSTGTATFTVEDTTAPTVTAPEDTTVECDGLGNADELEAWLNAGSASDACGSTTLANDYMMLTAGCGATGSVDVTWTATDGCGLTGNGSSSFAIVDTMAPSVTLNGESDVSIECGVDEYEEMGASATDTCDTELSVADVAGDTVDNRTPGTYEVLYETQDACGNAGEGLSRTVVVEDTMGPEIVEGAMPMLWPPNHRYVTLSLSDCVESVIDACSGEIDVDEAGVIQAIYSDEPENVNGNGDGNTTDDIVILDDSSFMVRAERSGQGNGRVYGIMFDVTDEGGNTVSAECHVGVPHDQSGDAPVDDGPDAGYQLDSE
jgi:hypothetical protein